MSSNEDVLELLDSLEKETKTKKSQVKSSKKHSAPSATNDVATSGSASPATQPRKSASKDRKNEDEIMGYLENLTKDSRTTSPEVIEGGADQTSVPVPQVPLQKEEQEPEQRAPSASSPTSENANPLSSITSWWSRNKDGLWDSATQAVKQAEAKVKQHEQAISKFGLSKEMLQSTLSSVLDTIAPPISRHEQLKIHIFHDIVGYPAIDNVVYAVFERVMEQVEGGDLEMVVQKGKERHRRGSDASQHKNLNLFRGPSSDAIKLAKANIEAIAVTTETLTLDGEEDDAKNASGQDAIRTSNVFLSIQPTTKQEGDQQAPNETNELSTLISSENPQSFSFVVHLMDVINKIEFTALSQPLPLKWVEWLESTEFSGSVDPREYVLEWIEEALALAVGIVAQSYVTRRMGCQ